MYIAGTTTWGLLALAFSLVLDIESVCSTGNDKTNQNSCNLYVLALHREIR